MVPSGTTGRRLRRAIAIAALVAFTPLFGALASEGEVTDSASPGYPQARSRHSIEALFLPQLSVFSDRPGQRDHDSMGTLLQLSSTFRDEGRVRLRLHLPNRRKGEGLGGLFGITGPAGDPRTLRVVTIDFRY